MLALSFLNLAVVCAVCYVVEYGGLMWALLSGNTAEPALQTYEDSTYLAVLRLMFYVFVVPAALYFQGALVMETGFHHVFCALVDTPPMLLIGKRGRRCVVSCLLCTPACRRRVCCRRSKVHAKSD